MHNCILAILFVVFFPEPLFAQVDQANWPDFIGAGFNSTTVHQEFTPSLNTLDSLQISIGQGAPAPRVPFPGSAAVTILDGGVAGLVIAESNPIHLPAFYSGAPVFHFSEPVSLTPGRTYAFQLVGLTSGTSWSLDASSPNFSPGYPGGRLSFGSGFVEGDLLFREGINIPEPSPSVLLVLGLVVIVISGKLAKTANGVVANRCLAGQLDGSGNLSATHAADRALPAAVAEL